MAIAVEIGELTSRRELLMEMRRTGVIPIASYGMVMDLVAAYTENSPPTSSPLAGASAPMPGTADVAGAEALRPAAPASLSTESAGMMLADSPAPGVLPGSPSAGLPSYAPLDTNEVNRIKSNGAIDAEAGWAPDSSPYSDPLRKSIYLTAYSQYIRAKGRPG